MIKKMALIISCLFLGALSFSCRQTNKTAYVNLNILYDTLPLKKELSIKLKSMQLTRKGMLDSMYYSLLKSDSLHKQGLKPDAEFIAEKEKFNSKKEQFQSDNEMIIKNFDKQIWKEINEDIKAYGEEKGYDYIFGANGSGTIMYASKGGDITNEIIKYVYGKGKEREK
jgi:outer membrane protein